MYVYHVLYACTYMYSKYNALDNNRRSWLRIQISLVMLSVSPSTVDCNSTTFQQKSSSGTRTVLVPDKDL